MLCLMIALSVGRAQDTAADTSADDAEAAAEAVAAPVALVPMPPPPRSHAGLWDEGRARMMFGLDGNAREVGDLITVRISESSSSSISSDTSTGRATDLSASIDSFFGLKKAITSANGNMEGSIGMGTSSGSSFAGNGGTSRSGEVEGVLTCTVIEVLPNGNLVIEGHKEVRSNKETTHHVLTGIVRPQDIQADNTVQSYLLASSDVQITGQGVIADNDGPGVGTRVWSRVWPF